MVAVIAPLEILILPTPPGDACPATGTLGTAINAVVLSVQTNMLSVEPGRVIVRATLSCALLTMARPLLAGLKTNVRSRFGLSTIMPASGSEVLSETV